MIARELSLLLPPCTGAGTAPLRYISLPQENFLYITILWGRLLPHFSPHSTVMELLSTLLVFYYAWLIIRC